MGAKVLSYPRGQSRITLVTHGAVTGDEALASADICETKVPAPEMRL